MPTRSFDIDLVLDTDEALQNFLDAIEEADRRGPRVIRDFSEELARGKALIAKGCPFDD
ncbi:MAG: hypothetical protein FWH47_07820 [Methanomassiliicoccaceae archaeon]|nr:hypothetical protein [Methanomassiliicoccaceae archaeon]